MTAETQVPEKNITLSFDNAMLDFWPKSERMFHLAQAYQIDSQEMLIAASDELKVVKAFAKELEATEKDLTKPLNDLKTKWIAFFKPARERLAQAEQQLKGGIDTYLNAQEQKRLAAQAEAERLVRVERARLEAEAQRIVEAAATASDQEQLAAAQQAQALQDQAMFVPVPIIAAEVQKVSGMSQTHTYIAELTDKMALIKAIAAGQVPDIYIDVNMTLLNKQAKALREQLNIPGVVSVKKTGITQKG